MTAAGLGSLEHRHLPDGYRAERTGIWVSVSAPGSAPRRLRQGWKLHLSARPATLEATLDRALPLLLEARCDFKIVASVDLLRDVNAGVHGPGAVGKAVTVYPDPAAVVPLARRLADVLAGVQGPRITSDRRVRPDSPVYYRYGPLAPRLRVDDAGRVDVVLTSPDGRVTSGLARDAYVAPEWAEDPFASTPPAAGHPVIGDHYRVVGAIARTHRGATYRAIDLRSGDRVVVKEARAFANETSEGDARTYLRQERAVLEALDGVPGVPRAVDHFAYGDDEYLVTTDLGVRNLRDDVVEAGVYGWDAERNVRDLARALLTILGRLHARGVVYRDLAPKNVVATEDGGWGLVDFELSRLGGRQLYGWSPGYSHARQRSNQPGTPAEDHFALGTTLFYAVTGLDPIIMDADPATNLARTVACLKAVCGEDELIVGIIRDLLQDDAGRQRDALRRVRKGRVRPEKSRGRIAEQRPCVEPVLRHTQATVLRHAEAILERDPSCEPLPPSVIAYDGIAGAAMELLRHPDTRAAAVDLARLAGWLAERIEMPPALLYGRLGVSLALAATGDPALRCAADALAPAAGDVAAMARVDITHGLAGMGLGFLELGQGDLADHCAERLLREPHLLDAQLRALPGRNPAHAISVADGFAHGRAGIAYFLLVHGSPEGTSRARVLMDHLARLVPDLASRARSSAARPMAASWCQGLAGIGAALVRGARRFNDESLLEAARTAASACLALAPRVPLVTQCCGLAGSGELLLDLAVVSGDERHRDDALRILQLMLLRSGGSPTAPSFPDSSLAASTPGWATGASGVLSFLRRLADPSSPRLWMVNG